MDAKSLFLALEKHLPFEPTSDQAKVMELLSVFISKKNLQTIFMLKGYAGTGKTTMVKALVKALEELGMNTLLLAPTGRAAKVLQNLSGQEAFTIHKQIYIPIVKKDGSIHLSLIENPLSNCLFIIDEASMIQNDRSSGDSGLFSGNSLLDDLIHYVFQGDHNKLLLIGDTAQLPPVKLDISPALDKKFLKDHFNIDAIDYELKIVVRQSRQSGILSNATTLRQHISKQDFTPPFFRVQEYRDILSITGENLEERLNDAFHGNNPEGTVVICRANKRANIFNQEIRKRILFKEDDISAGDMMMVVRNNYFWLSKKSKAGFIANGDMIEILRIKKREEMHGYKFADIEFRLLDYPDEPPAEAKIILDTIMAETPSMPFEENRKLYESVKQDYMSIKSSYRRLLKMRSDPYMNALQVKFSYALTCHKTQGGQWETVFIDQAYFHEDMIDKSWLRWLYTAVTRATKKLYLVNFNDRLFY